MQTAMSRFHRYTHWEKPFTKRFFSLAIPIMLQFMVESSLYMVDNVMIGQLGELEMAAVTQANRFTFLFDLAIFGLSSGASAFVAQAWGKRDVDRIHQAYGLALTLGAGFLMIFMTAAIGFPQWISSALLTNPVARGHAEDYLHIVGIGYLFRMVSYVVAAFQRSTEQTRLPMSASIAGICTNAILNYILIFGKLGLPAMGVKGAAVATLIAAIVECGIMVGGGYAIRAVTAVRMSQLFPKSRAFVAQFIKVVGAVVANEFLWSLGVTLYSVVYGRMGESAVASLSIAQTFEQFSVFALRAINGACAVLVGTYVGAGDREGSRETAMRMMLASLAISVVSAALLVAIGRVVINAYNVSDIVKSDALKLLWVMAGFMPLATINGLYIVGILRAGGDATYSLVIDVATVWFVGVPLVALAGLVLHWPITLVIIAAKSENIAKLIFCVVRFRSGKWIHDLTGA